MKTGIGLVILNLGAALVNIPGMLNGSVFSGVAFGVCLTAAASIASSAWINRDLWKD